MVQFFKGSADPRDAAYGQLASALGSGIGNGLNTYFANRSLQSVLQDKALEDAPTSEKLQKLHSALLPYGEKGQEVFKNQIQIEQQQMQEKQTKQQEILQKKKGKALGKYLNGGEISEDEQELFNPQEWVAIHKARNAKQATLGGLGGTPLSPEESKAVSDVIKENPDASAEELELKFNEKGILPGRTGKILESRRREQQTGSEHDIKFHQESSDFEKSVRKNADIAKKQIPIIEKSLKSVNEGKIKPTSLANVFSFFGDTGKKISNAILSGEESALLASIPEFLEGRKELFGVRLSDADLRLLQDKLPDIGKSKEANLAILDLMKRSANRALKLEKISEDVLEKKGVPYRSGKLRPLGYEREVMNAFDEFQENEGTFQQVPEASQHVGKIIEDDSGKRYKSNGKMWEPI